MRVQVCASRCVTVRLTDSCQCYRGETRERLIDLSDDAFARLAPLSRGVIRVTVEVVDVTPPETDR
jgi:rare lipoprotein A (peptidoglycan hydrolase)